MNIKTWGLAILFFVIIFSFGCSMFSSEPDEKTIQMGFVQCFGKSTDAWTVADFRITNKYKKEINKETVYVYEAKLKMKQLPPGTNITTDVEFACGLVKRGNSWYAVQ